MFTDKEIRKIKLYCVLPTLGNVALIVAITIGLLWAFLCMLDSVIFDSETGLYMPAFIIYIGTVVLYLAFYAYAILSVRLGQLRKKWQAIVEKAMTWQNSVAYTQEAGRMMAGMAAGDFLSRSGNPTAKRVGDALEAAAAVEAVDLSFTVGTNLEENAKRVAMALGLAVPKKKGKILLIIFVPVILLIGSFIPEYVHAGNTKRQEQQTAHETVMAVADVLDERCVQVIYQDPADNFHDYGYTITGYVDEEKQSYVYISVTRDGLIESVAYEYDINMNTSPAENIKKAQGEIGIYYSALKDAFGSDASDDKRTMLENADLFTIDPLENETAGRMLEKFKTGSYYDSVYESDDTDKGIWVSCSFNTDTKEDWDKYSEAYLYICIDDR